MIEALIIGAGIAVLSFYLLSSAHIAWITREEDDDEQAR